MDINNIPKAFGSPLRLSLVTGLVSGERNFKELKMITRASDGNISVQLTKLEKWGYITSKKEIVNRKMRTTYKISEIGFKQLEEYVELLDSILRQSR